MEVNKIGNRMVSVIVPIYGVEDYLERCIISLTEQTYENYEIILVDDGSPDGCPKICDDWEQKHPKVKVIHKVNGGLSDARNVGYLQASGDYIVFIDSDDWVHKDYLAELIGFLESEDCDVVECQFVSVSGEGEITEAGTPDFRAYTAQDALKELVLGRDFRQVVWNKVYKRSVIEGVSFPVGKLNEDEFWTYQVFGRAQKVGKINSTLYYYFQRNTSIIGSKYNLRRLDALEAKAERQAYIDAHYPALHSVALVNLWETMSYQGQMALMHLDGNERKAAVSKINHYRNEAAELRKMDYSECSRSGKLWLKMSKKSFWGTCKIKNCFGKGL